MTMTVAAMPAKRDPEMAKAELDSGTVSSSSVSVGVGEVSVLRSSITSEIGVEVEPALNPTSEPRFMS